MTTRLGIDTNVLLRIAIPDDAGHIGAIDGLLKRLNADDALCVDVSVVLEADPVLGRKYRYPRDRILDFIQAIAERREFEVAAYEAVGNAVHLCPMSNVDFADALLSEMNCIADCGKALTFDRKAASRVPGMELLA
jgi:predicted nucleic-acid-binding protein